MFSNLQVISLTKKLTLSHNILLTYKTFDLFLNLTQFLIRIYIMNNNVNDISIKRYMLIRNILDCSENKKIYND